MSAAPIQSESFGDLLRAWRRRRRLSQLELSLGAGVSSRHLSFLETGRSSPSREMVLQLGEFLELPLRERNALLAAAGFAPAYPSRPLDAPEMAAVRDAMDLVLRGHEPYPAIAVDRYWNIVAMNAAAGIFAASVDPELLGPPANVYRMSFHPKGLVPRIVNFTEYAHHLMSQLRHDVAVSGDPELTALLREVESYGTVPPAPPQPRPQSVVLPMRVRHPLGELSVFSVIATFGTPVDVTVSELAIETFFPADAATAERLRQLAGA
jgi:transcriptional regulator with XRE-family HTH domain